MRFEPEVCAPKHWMEELIFRRKRAHWGEDGQTSGQTEQWRVVFTVGKRQAAIENIIQPWALKMEGSKQAIYICLRSVEQVQAV